MAINPNAVIELCPCGTAYSFDDFPYVNQAPASDPTSLWQARLKGKTLKALMRPSAPFSGDHVALSDHGDDFASAVGIGAAASTKFTRPVDPEPKASFLLTPGRESLWRKWIEAYRQKRLAEGASTTHSTRRLGVARSSCVACRPGAIQPATTSMTDHSGP